MTEAKMEPTTDQDWYLEPERNLTRYGWLAAGLLGLLLVAGVALALVFGPTQLAGLFFAEAHATATAAPTLAPSATPPPTPTAVPHVTFAAQPWTDGRAPVGLVELTIQAPVPVQLSHRPPPGFRYWRGDLLQTRQAFAWTGIGPAEVRWFLLYGPEATFPATATVTVDGQALDLVLLPDTPATTTAVLK